MPTLEPSNKGNACYNGNHDNCSWDSCNCKCHKKTVTVKVVKRWETEFDKEFGNNVVWWQECLSEMRIGDPDFKRLKSFISIEKQKSYDEGMAYSLAEGIKAGHRQIQSTILEIAGSLPVEYEDKKLGSTDLTPIEMFNRGFNSCLSQIKQLLKQKLEK